MAAPPKVHYREVGTLRVAIYHVPDEGNYGYVIERMGDDYTGRILGTGWGFTEEQSARRSLARAIRLARRQGHHK